MIYLLFSEIIGRLIIFIRIFCILLSKIIQFEFLNVDYLSKLSHTGIEKVLHATLILRFINRNCIYIQCKKNEEQYINNGFEKQFPSLFKGFTTNCIASYNVDISNTRLITQELLNTSQKLKN